MPLLPTHREIFFHWANSESGQIQTFLKVGSSRKQPDRTNIEKNFFNFGNEALKELYLFCPLSAWEAAIGKLVVNFFQGHCRAEKWRMKLMQVKMTQSLLFSQESVIFLIKCYIGCCKSLVKYQISEKVDPKKMFPAFSLLLWKHKILDVLTLLFLLTSCSWLWFSYYKSSRYTV